MGLIRLIVIGAIVLTAIYFLVSVYSRSVRREKLEKEWDANPLEPGKAARDAFIEKGMADYESGFRKKLILLVYVIPAALVALAVYVTNTN